MSDNKKVAEFMFDIIRKAGYKPYDIEYGNGYFIFNMGENSVVHFKLKGVWKNWLFGMWIDTECLSGWYRYLKKKEYDYKDEDFKVVRIFCQHEHNIDKFKPSRSSLCVDFDIEDWKALLNGNEFYDVKLQRMLEMIKHHPILCYCDYCGDYVGYRSDSFLEEFIHYEWSYYKDKIEYTIKRIFWNNYTKAKLFFAKKSKIIDHIKYEDFEKENPGWSTSYDYAVIPTFKGYATDDKIDKWYRKWFRRDEYGKMDYDCIVEVRSFQIKGNEYLWMRP